jgi:hypothetical protein
VWRQHSDVAVVHDAAGAFVLPLSVSDATPIRISGTGLDIWNALDDWCSLDELTEALAGAYGIDPATARDHVEPFLLDLDARAAAVRRSGRF